MFGFCAALFGCLATSTKTILAEALLHGYKFDRYAIYALLFLLFFLSDGFLPDLRSIQYKFNEKVDILLGTHPLDQDDQRKMNVINSWTN